MMDVRAEIDRRAKIIDEAIERYIPLKPPLELYKACRHYLVAGGKRLRPCLALLTCGLVGGEENEAVPYAVAIEMIHNFTLIHDDIMDKDSLRRGVPTVHTIWGEEGAILAGDTLYSKAFEIITKIESKGINSECIGILAETCSLICEGQWMDIEFEKKDVVSEKEYLEMITKKTAVLYGAAAEIGGIVGGATPQQRKALYEYGKLCGIGFQIQDDILDIVADEKVIGKDRGSDIVEGKKTLIVIHAMSNGIEIPGFGNPNATPEDIESAVELLSESIEYSRKKAIDFVTRGKNMLDIFDECYEKKVLLELADYLVNRGF
jgi:geranylgeranyl diphosphate synthase type I